MATAGFYEFLSASFEFLHPRSPSQSDEEIALGSARAPEFKILPPKFTEFTAPQYKFHIIHFVQKSQSFIIVT
jgi:hypothetical protein